MRSGGPGRPAPEQDRERRADHPPAHAASSSTAATSGASTRTRPRRCASSAAGSSTRSRRRPAPSATEARRTLIGSGDRSQRIRTYNFPQNRVTDHRIGLTLYNLDRVIQGDLARTDHGPDRPRPPRAARRGVTRHAPRDPTRRSDPSPGRIRRPPSRDPVARDRPPTRTSRWTVGRLLTWTADFLKRRGAESPRLDAEVLLAHVLDWERVQLYTHYEDEVGERPRAAFRDLVRRRAEGTPVAYLVGRKEFYSLPLAVSPAVLIPRPDSEFVVVEFLAVAKALELPARRRRRDRLGLPGPGLRPAAPVGPVRGDRPQPRGPGRRRGQRRSRTAWPTASTSAQGDLLEPVADEGPFDVILSNPPYIPTADIATLEPGVRDLRAAPGARRRRGRPAGRRPPDRRRPSRS